MHKLLGGIMVELDRIKQLAKEKGISLAFICSKLGLQRGYFVDVSHGRTTISDERMNVIAEILNTTVDYLHGKTDKKEKPGIVAELSERDIRILNIIRKLPDDVLDALELDLYRKGLL
jgi:transcriptional regulator with XRE-family HTH domain